MDPKEIPKRITNPQPGTFGLQIRKSKNLSATSLWYVEFRESPSSLTLLPLGEGNLSLRIYQKRSFLPLGERPGLRDHYKKLKILTMCDFETLHQSDFGHSAICRHCGKLHVTFGTCMMGLNHDEFQGLMEEINKQISEQEKPDEVTERCYLFQTDSHKIKLTLSYNELPALSELLCHSAFILEVKSIMST